MKIAGLDKIYIVHYAKLKDRKKYLLKKIKELKINNLVEWDIAPENEILSEYSYSKYDSSERGWRERLKILGPPWGGHRQILNKSAIAVTLQHFKIIAKIANKKSQNISMIVEDDALFEDNFLSKLKELIKKLNTLKWDICYTDKGGLIAPIKNVAERSVIMDIYQPKNKQGNTTGSYLVNSSSARKITSIMKRFSLAIDAELDYIQKKHNLNVLWSVPFLTKQGTIEGVYASNIRNGSWTLRINKLLKKIERKSPLIARILARTFQTIQRIKNKIKVN